MHTCKIVPVAGPSSVLSVLYASVSQDDNYLRKGDRHASRQVVQNLLWAQTLWLSGCLGAYLIS